MPVTASYELQSHPMLFRLPVASRCRYSCSEWKRLTSASICDVIDDAWRLREWAGVQKPRLPSGEGRERFSSVSHTHEMHAHQVYSCVLAVVLVAGTFAAPLQEKQAKGEIFYLLDVSNFINFDKQFSRTFHISLSIDLTSFKLILIASTPFFWVMMKIHMNTFETHWCLGRCV